MRTSSEPGAAASVEEDLRLALETERARWEAAAESVVRHPWGSVLLSPSLPRVFDANLLWVEGPTSAATVIDEAEHALREFAHRKLFVPDAAVAAALGQPARASGYRDDRTLYMAHRRTPDRAAEPGLAREVDRATIRAVERAALADQPWITDGELADQLLRYRDVNAAAVDARYFVAAGASACTLYTTGRVAQIEEVATLLAHRNRGLARAVVLAALDAACAAGAGLVFLAADDLDWPKELYRKLGFDLLGAVEVFTRRPG